MTKKRAPDIAFAISGVSVAVSLLATSALPGPDIPGIVLVLTGGLACLLSLRQRREREFQILGTLVVLTAAIVGLHRLWHRLGVPHDWLGPLYLGAIVVYCAVAISVSRRLLRPRDGGLPPA